MVRRAAARGAVVAAAALRCIPDGGQLDARGDPPDGWYGLLKGAIKVGAAAPEGIEIALHLPQEELAQLLGASRRRINQELKAWERSGWLAVRYGRVVILDAAALQRAAVELAPP